MKSGFVAVVGKPNTGKSTLINAPTGSKVSIVSEKPQTTRFKLRAILNRPETQIIFVDTPGSTRPGMSQKRVVHGNTLTRRQVP